MTRESVYSWGANEFTDMIAQPEIRVKHFDHAELDASTFTLDFPVEPGTFVEHVNLLVEEAFAGGTPALNVGDGTTADLFLAAANVAETTLNSFAVGAVGKYYPTGGVIRVTGVTGLTAGKGALHIVSYKTKGNGRIPDL